MSNETTTVEIKLQSKHVADALAKLNAEELAEVANVENKPMLDVHAGEIAYNLYHAHYTDTAQTLIDNALTVMAQLAAREMLRTCEHPQTEKPEQPKDKPMTDRPERPTHLTIQTHWIDSQFLTEPARFADEEYVEHAELLALLTNADVKAVDDRVWNLTPDEMKEFMPEGMLNPTDYNTEIFVWCEEQLLKIARDRRAAKQVDPELVKLVQMCVKRQADLWDAMREVENFIGNEFDGFSDLLKRAAIANDGITKNIDVSEIIKELLTDA